MIALAIIAILAAIVLPSWNDHVLRVGRSDARVALSGFAQALERYLVTTGSWSDATTALYATTSPQGLYALDLET